MSMQPEWTHARTLEGHRIGVSSVAFSPDGRLLASASYDTSIRFWDPVSGACLRSLEGPAPVSTVDFSPDGRLLVSGGWDRIIRVWDPASGACLRTLEGHTDGVRAVAFDREGRLLASASNDTSIRLWDPASGACLRTLDGQIGDPYAVAFSSDGALASAGDDVRLWDPASGACLRTLQGNNPVAYSPDGTLLASATEDNSIRVWDPVSGACLRTLNGHDGLVTALAFSPDGKLLASGSWDHCMRIWDSVSGDCLQTLEVRDTVVTTVVFSSDGKRLASGSKDAIVRLWEVRSVAAAEQAGPQDLVDATETSRHDRVAADAIAASIPNSLPVGPLSTPSSGPHAVRVFVSSTFRDMGAERDELVKRTFPALRKLCESRGVTWGEVDLRWGITDEQRAEGQVLPICLAEIEGCRPYFIALLGERYGWVPEAIDPALIERRPWLAEQVSCSVTETEILHGALRDPTMSDHAFFYLRDPAYVRGRPAEQFAEVPTADEVASVGPEEAERRAVARRAKLAALKERIRTSGSPVHENYADPRALGELVLADLAAVIESLYPAGSEPDPLAREALEHEAFARSRAGVYIGRPDYFAKLDAHAAGDDPPLVVLGDSGSGKSALLANWALAYQTAHPDQTVISHFIGASAQSADWAAMVRRIMGELIRRFDLSFEIPDDPDALRGAFASALHMAAAKGRVVMVIDALNGLEDLKGALDLTWLTPVMPDRVCLVLSTLPGPSLAETEKRRWPSMVVQPLEPADRMRLIADYLAQYSRKLGEERAARIAAAHQSANPLFLRTLLDELRLWGEHETLDDAISRYLAAQSVDSLYELILTRYEVDYERDRPGLVRDAFSLLWAARRGLSETELLELLGTPSRPLPHAHWSPLYLAAEQSLVDRSGLLGFSHDYLRRAVERRYLAGEQARQAAHLRLADYFTARENGPRKIEELTWQLRRGKAWQRLYGLMTDLAFLEADWDADQFDVKLAWAELEGNSTFRMVEAYRPVLDAPAKHATDRVFGLANLLQETGHPEQALLLFGNLNERLRETSDWHRLQAALGNQAMILRTRGDLEGAMALLKEQERTCLESGDRAGLPYSLGNQALILRARGDLDGATALQVQVQRICRELGDLAGLHASLGNHAAILILRHPPDLDEAMALLAEKEQICRRLGDPAGLAASLGNQAVILHARGDAGGALALHKRVEGICRAIGDPAGLATALDNQAAILADRGDLNGAQALFREEERICRELGDRAGLERSLGNQAAILHEQGDLNSAEALFRQAEQICRELDNPAQLQDWLGKHALTLQERGDLNGAMALLEEKERICRRLSDWPDLALSLGSRGWILAQTGRPREALALLEEAQWLARQYGPVDLAQGLSPVLAALRRGG